MSWTTADIPSQRGRVIVITGANTGLGLETARTLAARGAEVVLAVRDPEKGKAAAHAITTTTPGATVTVQPLDLTSLTSIRTAATDLRSRYDHIDVLINNAGVMYTPKSRTQDGFDLQFGTNHLGHFALTGLLLPIITDRVVTVSSVGHRILADIHFDDLTLDRNYNRIAAYGQSKLANLLFTYELNRRLTTSTHPTSTSSATHTTPRAAPSPTPVTAPHPAFVTATHPASGSATHSAPGTAPHPAPGTATHPGSVTGAYPPSKAPSASGDATSPTLGTATHPASVTVAHPPSIAPSSSGDATSPEQPHAASASAAEFASGAVAHPTSGVALPSTSASESHPNPSLAASQTEPPTTSTRATVYDPIARPTAVGGAVPFGDAPSAANPNATEPTARTRIAVAAHPGISNTELSRNSPPYLRHAIRALTPLLQTPAMGALPILRAATDPTTPGATYYGPDGFAELRGHPIPVRSSRKSHDRVLQSRLWTVSEQLTEVHYDL
ncbi:oxidoreductase [Actinokineospora soli]|uniref:Oxidoreductase n=1 Tax=Actinokineospora soli TaxID=1048753 RepID=A0ABW2TML4_9PSEU